jgi:hypothetical protein
LGERYRVEQVFGSVKGVYGSYVSGRRWKYARVQVWGMLVLWNLVQWLRVGGGAGNFWCVSLVFWVDGAQGKGILEHPQRVLTGVCQDCLLFQACSQNRACFKSLFPASA